MRRASLFALFLLLVVSVARADTIVLKNGRRITATTVEEEGDRVYYETSAGWLSFPKSLVDHIERGGYSDFATARSSEPPVEAPKIDPGEGFDEIMQATLAGGSINRNYLARLEEEARGGLPQAVQRAAMGYHAAAQFLLQRGDSEHALQEYRRGLILAPEHYGLLVSIAQVHLLRTEYTEALPYLERARRVEPDSADVAKLAGWAYYGQNKIELAVKEWKRAYQLRADYDVALALEKAQRDAAEESAYKEGESSHFVLRYNGQAAAPELVRDVLRTLEGHFSYLESELHFTPPEPIGVVLYTDQAYFDITTAPAWTGAVNDGRIRVPVQGLTSVTPQLSRTLRHELTHSFLRQKTRERCPTWLHEGLAQWMEGKRGDADLADWYVSGVRNQQMPSLSLMEGSWLSLPPQVAQAFYYSSLLVVEYLVERYGMGDVERLLSRLATESSTEAAVQAVFRMDYDDLRAETAKYLQRTYLH